MALFNNKIVIVDDDIRGRIRILAIDRGSAKKIRDGIKNGSIDYVTHVLKDGERLDALAGRFYGDSGQWRVLAAANGIGWALQAQVGLSLFVPTDLAQVYAVV